MAKRHSSLRTLSQDHHEGLLLALRLQQGTRALLRLWSHDVEWQARAVVSFYEDHLKRHFRAEEEALFPTVLHYVPATASLVKELLLEHRTLASLAAEFRNPTPEDLAARLTAFGKLLELHIRKEDRQLFPMIERRAPEDILIVLKQRIDEHYPEYQ